MTAAAAPLSWWDHVARQADRSAAARDLTGPALVDALTEGQRYETRGAVHVLWHPGAIGTHCSEAPGRTVTATAAPVSCAACTARVLADHAAELAATEPEPEPEEAGPVLIVVGCGKAKRTEAAPAADLYTGSYHRQARRAADAIAARAPHGARVMVLSARHGLVDLADVLEPYDETLPYRRALDGPGLIERRTARQLAATGARTVIALCSSRYAAVLRHAAGTTGADLLEPLAGTTSQGDQLRRFAAIRDGRGDLAEALADAVAGPMPTPPAIPAPDELIEDARGQLALFAA